MRTWTLVVMLLVVIAACSDSDSSDLSTSTRPSVETTAAAGAHATTPQEVNTTTSVASAPTTSFETDGIEVGEEVLDYLAAVEELLAGTAYADAVSEDPDVFLATGFVFCERLSQGEEPATTLTDYVEALTGSDIEAASDDELNLAGTILGTAVGHLCPEHTTMVEQGF